MQSTMARPPIPVCLVCRLALVLATHLALRVALALAIAAAISSILE